MKLHESLRLYSSENAYLLEPTYLDPKVRTENLVIDRESGFIRRNVPANPQVSQDSVKTIYGIFGLVKMFSGDVLIVITGREKIGQIDGHEIWKVSRTELLPLARNKLHLSDRQIADEDAYLVAAKDLLAKDHFYFSYTFDISHSMQNLISADIPLWQKFDLRFYFNRHLQRRMIELSLTDPEQNLSGFILPVMSGFISINQLNYSNKMFTFILISRRSCARTGTRYFSRGIDNEGNVSNFVETEQMLLFGKYTFSHVQIRGSIPLYWKQVINIKYKPQMVVHSTPSTIEAMRKHFDELKATYGPVLCFNLVDKRGYELEVGSTFTDFMRQFPDVIYSHFDFHQECKKMQWQRISNLFNEYENQLNDQSYYFNDGSTVLKLQTSVVRTNCIDCLDRTNVVQSELARMILTRQLREAQIFPPKLFLAEVSDLNTAFKNVWADNADVISLMYSGTGALKTDFTRTGKRTKSGALQDGLNSVIRYIRNNFLDGKRQDIYDLFSGKSELSAARNLPLEEHSIRFYVIPLIILISFLMLFFTFWSNLIFGTGNYSMILFWALACAGSLRLVAIFGRDFVNLPRMINPYDDQLMQRYLADRVEMAKKPAQL